MLGHALWRVCRDSEQTHATIRAASVDVAGAPLEDAAHAIPGVRAEDPETIEHALDVAQPDVVVNCIGVVKQAAVATGAVALVRTNALLPHQLAAACCARDIRLIHVSTDCVFSGRRGRYGEDDTPDPVDLYGRSKLAGEPSGPRVLTLRTSMIGWELGGRRQGLLEWFVAQRGGSVRGYTEAVFSGPTASALSHAILAAIERNPDLAGTWHVAAASIAKHDLLLALRSALGLEVEIVPDDELKIDRSLDGSEFEAATGWTVPGWEQMIAELVAAAPPRALGDTVARR
jgi:dTDP-4-dehydrorhamnose reductase